VTFLLVAYNQAAHIEEAVAAGFAQTYGPLEIIVSDDCSSDGTYTIASRMADQYRGPHRVTVRRNERNLGLIGHICAVMREVRGDLIVVAAGDDISCPERVEKLVDAWNATGRRSGSIFSRYKTIHPDGTITSNRSTPRMTVSQLSDRSTKLLEDVSVGALGCTHAWTKDVFEVFGQIDPRVVHEDVTIPLRSLLIGNIVFIPDELVLYRLTPGSLSRLDFRGHRERMRKMARYWEGRLANYEQFQKDAATALQANRIDPGTIEWVQAFLKAKENVARRHVQFYTASALMRFGVLLRAWRDLPLSQRLKWLVIAAVPWSYGLQLRRETIRRNSRARRLMRWLRVDRS